MRFLDSTFNYSEPQVGGGVHRIDYKMGKGPLGEYEYVDPQPTTARAGESVTVGYRCTLGGIYLCVMGWYETGSGDPPNSESLHDIKDLDGSGGTYTFTMPDEDVTVWIMDY